MKWRAASRTEHAAVALLAICAAPLINFGGYSALGLILLVVSISEAGFAVASKPGDNGLPRWMLVAFPALSLLYIGPFSASALAGSAVLMAASLLILKKPSKRWVVIGIASAPLGLLLIALTQWHWGVGLTDVYSYLTTATERFLHGQNPYSGTVVSFEELHPGELDPVQTPFAYGPAAVLASVPGVVLGDVRISSLLAVGLMLGACFAIARRSGANAQLKMLTLLLPVAPVLLVHAFVDLYAIAGMALWLALRNSHRKLAVLALALAIPIKPILLISLTVFFFRSKQARNEIIAALAIAALICFPFALVTGVPRFWDDTVGLATRLPSYSGALSANSFVFAQFGVNIPTEIAAACAALALIAVIRISRNDDGSFAIGSALVTLVFVALLPYSFVNFYIYPTILLVIGLASGPVKASTDDARQVRLLAQ